MVDVLAGWWLLSALQVLPHECEWYAAHDGLDGLGLDGRSELRETLSAPWIPKKYDFSEIYLRPHDL